MKITKERQAEALQELRETLTGVETVYTTTEYSASGNSAYVKLYIVLDPKLSSTKRAEIYNITHLVALVRGSELTERGHYSIVKTGYGYSKSDAAVSDLCYLVGVKSFKHSEL